MALIDWSSPHGKSIMPRIIAELCGYMRHKTEVEQLREIAAEMRNRKVNGNRESPTLVAWAKRIDEACDSLQGKRNAK